MTRFLNFVPSNIFVSDIAIFVLKKDVKLQLTNFGIGEATHFKFRVLTDTRVLYTSACMTYYPRKGCVRSAN